MARKSTRKAEAPVAAGEDVKTTDDVDDPNRIVAGGLKLPTDKRDPLVGEDSGALVENPESVAVESDRTSTRTPEHPVLPSTEVEDIHSANSDRFAQESRDKAAADRLTPEGQRPISSEGHGAQAVVDLAVDRAVEAEHADPDDQPLSAEAADQGHVVKPEDLQRAELDAASHAEALGKIEAKVGPDNVGAGIRVAGNLEGSHVANVRRAAEAKADSDDKGEGHVSASRSAAALDEQDKVDSPHGRVAEAHDPWQAARWAPQGDMNVPAVSYGPKGSGALYGAENPTTKDQIRGLEGDSDAEVERVRKREGKGGVSIARERDQENRAAVRIGEAEVDTLESLGR